MPDGTRFCLENELGVLAGVGFVQYRDLFVENRIDYWYRMSMAQVFDVTRKRRRSASIREYMCSTEDDQVYV